MKAVVVYESLWGNTAAVARAIAEGIGPEARALSTAEAAKEVVAGADLIVAGSPLFAFQLPTDKIRETIRSKAATFPKPPDLSHPPLRAWLETVPAGQGHSAAFETRIWWSPGGAAGSILKALKKAGYESAGSKRFRVAGMYGPLKAGEIERARKWGARLARDLQA
jgi:flavorubredoxin